MGVKENLESREHELVGHISFMEEKLAQGRAACEQLVAQLHGHAGALEECRRVMALLAEEEKEKTDAKDTP